MCSSPRTLPPAFVLVILVALPCSALAQGRRPPDQVPGNREPVGRVTLIGGMEPAVNRRQGVFVSAEYALARRWSLGYAADSRFSSTYTPGESSVLHGATMRAATMSYRPWRWIGVYGGAGVARVSGFVDPAPGRPDGRYEERRNVAGAVAGAALRLHDRPYRFYTLRAHWDWLPQQQLTRRSDLKLGLGFGLTF